MVKDDDQKTAGSSTADSNLVASVDNVVEDADTDAKRRPSSSGASQPAEYQRDEDADTAPEGTQDTSAEEPRALEEELNEITTVVPILYAKSQLQSCFVNTGNYIMYLYGMWLCMCLTCTLI